MWRSARKLSAALLLGLVTAAIVWAAADPLVGTMAGWMTTGLVYTGATWAVALRMTPEQTRAHATAEDPGRPSTSTRPRIPTTTTSPT